MSQGLGLDLDTLADCQANVVELEQELEGVRDSTAWILASQQEELAKTVATMDTHNGQIADLKQDLNKRNEQVIRFVQKLKEIKESLAGQGRNPSPDLLVEEVGSIESLDWDYEYKGVLRQSCQFIEAGGGAGGRGEVGWPAGGAMGLREALEAGEREQEELGQYLNTKLADISQLKVEVGVVKEAKVVWEQKLEKSLTAGSRAS